MPNRVFSFPEAEIWVAPAGLASQNIGYARRYDLRRRPVSLEDGATAYYDDTLEVESPWVDDDVPTLFEAAGPFSAFVRWLNEDDNRLASVSVTGGILEEASRRPEGEGKVETFTFRLNARSLK